MSRSIAEVVLDAQQFHRHIIRSRRGNEWETEEKVFQKADARAIRDLAGAMKDLALVMRNIYDIPTIQERQSMELAQEKLALEKERTRGGLDAESGQTGVIEIARVLEDEEQGGRPRGRDREENSP